MNHLTRRQLEFVNLRFGMFIHFSPTSYLDLADHLERDHAPPRQGLDGVLGTADDLSPALVNPTAFDPEGWADAAVSAGMKYGALTTKHHEGFCNWPSATSDYTVREGCGIDIVGGYVRAFRSRGLKVGFYYSIRDKTAEIGAGQVDEAKIRVIEDQLTELLTGYGPIEFIIFDAWQNEWHESPSFEEVPYARIRALIKRLQPDCLVINHSQDPRYTDVVHYEQNAGQVLDPASMLPAQSGPCLQSRWFWDRSDPVTELKSVQFVVEDCLRKFNSQNANLILNCAPNREGRMDENVLERLREIGAAWQRPAPLTNPPAAWTPWPGDLPLDSE